jgi:hypothetical protein
MDLSAPLLATTTHRRRNARLRIRRGVSAQVLTLTGQTTVSLLDLSASGAQVRVKAPLRCGQDVMLWWLGFEAFGQVVRANGEEAGVAFHDPLPLPVLVQTRQQIDAGLAPTAARDAYQAAREWYMGLR